MATLRPPSASPSPSPSPSSENKHRASMGPSSRAPGNIPLSPRPGGGSGARPTSELLGSAGMFQTMNPEAEAIEQWFENLQNYESTLEEMAAASLDVNFKEELSAIEQWFKVLSEAERTAALYSLLQHSTQVQIRFFITVLQQMSKSDPMTALLSPAVGGSMQSQMEAKLASMSLKSPGLKSTMPSSPTMRNFTSNANRASGAGDGATNSFLSPESAAATGLSGDAAATLAQQRAKLKASNAAHRISAPVLSSPGPDGRAAWGPSSPLGQVVEQNAPAQEIVVGRPKSTEFSGSPRPGPIGLEALSPMVGDSWANMVPTPSIPMFDNPRQGQTVDASKAKMNDWSSPGGVPRMGDPKVYRRQPKQGGGANDNSAVYDNDGNLVPGAQQRRNGNGNPGGLNVNNQAWNRSPGLPPNGNDAGQGGLGISNGFGMGMGMASPGLGMGMPGMGAGGMGLMGMGQISPFMMNMAAMGMTPEAQILAAQMAAGGGFGNTGWMGMQPPSAGMNNRRGPPSTRSTSGNKAASNDGRGGGGSGGKKDEEDFDPQILNDVPAWLRSLRLHKYTPNFEGKKWQEMVIMDEDALEKQGVAALGARRKMLKTFEVVRKKMGIEGGPAAPA